MYKYISFIFKVFDILLITRDSKQTGKNKWNFCT